MLLHNKKGVSEIVSYVLLIVIAIGLSVAVAAYLRVQVPKDKTSCSTDFSLLLEKIDCKISNGEATLTATYRNTGLFTVDAVYARVAPAGKKVKQLINDPNNQNINPSVAYSRFYFIQNPNSTIDVGLKPGQVIQHIYQTSLISLPGKYEFEAQPAIIEKDSTALCPNIVEQTISCS